MALSNGNGLSNGPLIFLNPRSQDKEGNKVAPHFEVARVGEDKKIAPTGETATQVSGELLRPRFISREYKGVENKHVVLYIRDGDETYNLDLTYRISSRSLFNALLSLTDPKGIEISIYESKKGYEALSLWQNGDMVPWKFDGRKGEIPEAITVKFKGKDQHDFTPVDDFFEENLKAWADEVFGSEKAKNAGAPAQTESDGGTGNESEITPVTVVKPKPTAKPAVAPSKTAGTVVKPAVSKAAVKPAVSAPPAENLDEDVPF